MTILPQYLKKKPKEANGPWHIYPYTEVLAKRPDMFPHWPDGVDPNAPKTTGLSVDDNRAEQWQAAMQAKDKELADAMRRIADQAAEIDRLQSELRKAYELAPAVEIKQIDPERQAIINQAVKEMFDESNNEDFTSQGLPRVERIEQRCGFDIISAERDEAVKAYKQ